jgi:hypothetical protein
VGAHAQGQRAQAAVHEEAVERAGHGADRLLHEAHLLVHVGVAHDHGAPDDVGVPPEVLRGGVHDGVGAVLERALVDRRGEGVVDRDDRVAPASDDRGDVDDVEQRVGRRLDPDQARVGAHSSGHRVDVGLVDHRVAQAPAREDLVDEAVGAAIEVGGNDDVVAGRAHGGDQRVGGGHARGEGRRVAALQIAQRALEGAARGVGAARVVVVLDDLADGALHEGRGLMDGGDDRAERRVGLEARADDAGAEVVGHRASASSRSARVRMPVARPCSVTISA